MSPAAVQKNGLISDFTLDSPYVDAYVTLYEQLCVSVVGQPKPCIVVTSAGRGEGRSTVAANLAIVSARIGRRKTLLIDAETNRPSLARMFDVKEGAGLSNVLEGEATCSSAAHAIDGDKLSLLTAGVVGSLRGLSGNVERLRAVRTEWEAEADVTIIDAPPVLGSGGAIAWGQSGAGLLVVVHAGRTREAVLKRAAQRLRVARVEPLGVVLNRRRHTIPGYVYRWL